MPGITEPLLQVQRALPATLLLVAVSSMLALGAGHLQGRSALSEETGTSFGCPAAARLICTRQAATRELLEQAPGGKPICCLHTQDGEEGAALPCFPGSTGGCCGRQEEAGAVSSPITLSTAVSSHAWPFSRYSSLLFSHTFLLSCQSSVSDLTAEMAELSTLTHSPAFSFLLQLQGVSSTCRETATLSLQPPREQSCSMLFMFQ